VLYEGLDHPLLALGQALEALARDRWERPSVPTRHGFTGLVSLGGKGGACTAAIEQPLRTPRKAAALRSGSALTLAELVLPVNQSAIELDLMPAARARSACDGLFGCSAIAACSRSAKVVM
jgi:hypothetical protein